ncbi:putative short-chain dehydrogenase [Annulohypoxylon bovei var. microspora]|nr:putative short-chain dehydrogenase [Annulohypoxylon bovei var. microspora]
MIGTVILTGANGSAGLHASEHLLKTYPLYTAVLVVRSAADTDVNTNTLPDLTAVHKFATTISDGIASGQYPTIKSIICNAAYWNLVDDPETTIDGFDKSIQIGHIAHVALILRLLGHFSPDGGRVELISSVAHYRKKTAMSPYLPEIPGDLDLLIHPLPDADKQGRGFQRYSTLKLVITTWLYPLNEYLQKDPKLAKITAVAQNPGNLGDSRVFRTNTPNSIKYMQKFIANPLMPLINRFVDPTFRPSSEAGVDIIDLGVGMADDGDRGYYTLLKKDEPDPSVLDKEKQRLIWVKSAEWAKINKENTALNAAFE